MANDVPATESSQANFRELLLHEEEDLRRQLAELGYGDAGGPNYDPNFADSSHVTAERGTAEALAVPLLKALADVLDAIHRLDEGTYGRCERCGQPIEPARLEAMPAARRCIRCASQP
ncbi:MAG TPA: TraR/DksA C4-type zinc finger protein [Acidimicrobiales bacterium]|nr:TraR/DksA C4-type zinc finger protein [Acidimicrobiales bacterium]HLH47052.1 TraR/DksA C4-type zinc finger protein [Acidimicrobiales bacterium]